MTQSIVQQFAITGWVLWMFSTGLMCSRYISHHILHQLMSMLLLFVILGSFHTRHCSELHLFKQLQQTWYILLALPVNSAQIKVLCAISSVVERFVDIEEARSSILLSRTMR